MDMVFVQMNMHYSDQNSYKTQKKSILLYIFA